MNYIISNHKIKFLEIADIYDKARLICISNNGASQWLNVPTNDLYSEKFNNNDMYYAMKLFLGLSFTTGPVKCKGCDNKICDEMGIHALQCPALMATYRHDPLCDLLNNIIKQAGYQTIQEARYNMDDNGNKIRIQQRPGDIKILNFDNNIDTDDKMRDVYLDLVVGNIYAKSYINNTSKQRLWLATNKQYFKNEKYHNTKNVIGLGVEVLGGLSKEFNKFLHKIAERIHLKNNVPAAIVMNRIRSRLLAKLMKCNVRMIKKCYGL